MRVQRAPVLTGMTVAVALRSAGFGRTFGADSPRLAAIVGRAVPGPHVGSSAIPVLGRPPLPASSQAQTAQAAAHRRYHLGPALGTKLLTETGFGPPFGRPIARLREFLALRQSTQNGTADFHGELLTAATPVPARVPGAESGVPCWSPWRVLGHRDRGRGGSPSHLGTPRRTGRMSAPTGRRPGRCPATLCEAAPRVTKENA
jgi:Luciferase-like monooxygenase